MKPYLRVSNSKGSGLEAKNEDLIGGRQSCKKLRWRTGVALVGKGTHEHASATPGGLDSRVDRRSRSLDSSFALALD
jgi:hypothetical protein